MSQHDVASTGCVKKVAPKEFGNFSSTEQRYGIKLYTLVTASISR